jgi:hypothetical protein
LGIGKTLMSLLTSKLGPVLRVQSPNRGT